MKDKSNTYNCRKLTVDDLEMVMNWRMLPEITKFMNTDPVLTIEAQRLWYDKMSAGDFYYWIIEVDRIPCGLINLADIDKINKRCTWGYYIAEKKLRSFELAMSLEMSLYDYVFDKIGLNKITGESFCINTAIKIHELCGCITEGVLKQHILKNGQYFDVTIQSMFAETWSNIRNNLEYQKIDFLD